ncbi:hypothetical protein AAVH_28983 [Aphelenchoides avenae]|nr:hypothetical protein AAVH_28983 [Aphelenchus avenae]
MFGEDLIQSAFRQLNATLHASGGYFDTHYVDCSLNPGPLTFTFGEPGAKGVTYSIPFSQLITNVDGVCQLNIMQSPDETDIFSIGLPFLREYCVLPNSIGDHTVFSTPLELFNYDFTLWEWDKHLDGSASFVYRGKNRTLVGVLFNHKKPQFATCVLRTPFQPLSQTKDGPTVFHQPLITYRDRNVAVEQSIGSPPQKLRLVVDLSSENTGLNGITRIPGACCIECCNQRRFAPWNSSSFREINNDVGVTIVGDDVMQFPNSVGDRIMVSTPLEVVNYDFTLWDWNERLDGSAGFLYLGRNTTFLDALFNHVIPQFAMYVHRTCNDSYAIAGSMAYGTLENEGCS